MATTIGALAYTIRADTAGFAKDLGLTKKELAATKKIMRDTREPADLLADAQKNLMALYDKGALNAKEYAKALDKVDKEYKQLTGSAEEATGGVGTFNSQMGGKMPGGSGKAVAALGTVAIAVLAVKEGFDAVVASGQAAIDFIGEGIASGAEQIDLAKKTGLGTDDVAAFKLAGERLGVEFDIVQDSIKEFGIRVSEAANADSGPVKDIFDELGISISEIDAMAPAQAFQRMAKEISSLTDEKDRLRVADELMGDAGQQLIRMFEDEGAALRDAREDVDKFGLSMSEAASKDIFAAQKAINDMQIAAGGLQQTLAAEMAPAVTTLVEGITDLLQAMIRVSKTEAFQVAMHHAKDAAEATAAAIGLVVDGLELIMGVDRKKQKLESDFMSVTEARKQFSSAELKRVNFSGQDGVVSKSVVAQIREHLDQAARKSKPDNTSDERAKRLGEISKATKDMARKPTIKVKKINSIAG